MDHELEVSVHGLEYEKQVLKGSLVGGSKNSVHLDDVWMTCTSQNPKLLHDHARVARRVKAFSHAFDGHLSASVKIRRQPDFSVGAPTDAAMNSVTLRLRARGRLEERLAARPHWSARPADHVMPDLSQTCHERQRQIAGHAREGSGNHGDGLILFKESLWIARNGKFSLQRLLSPRGEELLPRSVRGLGFRALTSSLLLVLV